MMLMCLNTIAMNYSHPDFVRAYEAGLIKILVEKNLALGIANSPMLPANCRAAHIFWTWTTFLLIPLSIYFTFFRIWWVGLVILFIVMPAFWRGAVTSAQQWVLEFSLKDANFYAKALSLGALVVKPADQPHP